MLDHHNLRMWQSNLIESEQLTDGSMRVGTRFREVRRLGRRPSEIQAEITAFEPNQRFATKTVTEPPVTVNYDFEAADGGTRRTYTFVMLTRAEGRQSVRRRLRRQVAQGSREGHRRPGRAAGVLRLPTEHWIHLRTTNPIESTFATVRLRQRVTKGSGSRAAGVAMAFKLIESAQHRWRAVNAPHLVVLVRAGAVFENGKLVERPDESGGEIPAA